MMKPSRYQMYNKHPFKLGLFGANCSSGRTINKLPERWLADWDNCETMAKMADDAGIDFILPIGRWKGYGGETDFQGTTFETITSAFILLLSKIFFLTPLFEANIIFIYFSLSQ